MLAPAGGTTPSCTPPCWKVVSAACLGITRQRAHHRLDAPEATPVPARSARLFGQLPGGAESCFDLSSYRQGARYCIGLGLTGERLEPDSQCRYRVTVPVVQRQGHNGSLAALPEVGRIAGDDILFDFASALADLPCLSRGHDLQRGVASGGREETQSHQARVFRENLAHDGFGQHFADLIID